MSGHTKGPWYWDFDRDDMASLRSEGDNEPVMIDIACYPSLEDRCLIAAAPDLLEALQGMMKCFDDGVGEHWNAEELDAARAAIARTKGEA